MARTVMTERWLKKGVKRKSHMVRVSAIGLVLTLGLVGCAGPSVRPVEGEAFEHRAWEDQRRHSLQNTEPDPAVQPDRPSKTGRILPEDARLEDYLLYAMQHNPDLEAAFYRWRAALERIPQARALPDPRVSLAVVLDQVDRSAEYMGERYTLEQMFPWFGKLALSGDMASAQAHAEAQRFESIRLQLVDRVNRAYFEYAFQHQAVIIARENLDLLVRLEAVVRAMFRAGSAGLSGVNRAQIEIGRLDDQVRSLEDFLGIAAAELNAALGRPADASLPAVPAGPSEQAVSELPEYSDKQWLALMGQYNPELIAARHNAEQQRQGVALAHKNYYPDITVGVEYARDGSARMAMMDRGGADMLSGMIAVNVPIWRNKYDAGVREARARLNEANRQIESLENRLETDLKKALYSHRDSLRKLALYGDTLLPMVRQTLAVTETAYRTGGAGFTDLIDAQRVLLEFSLAHERAATDRAQAFTRIQALVGRLMDGDPSMETPTDGGVHEPAISP